MKTTIELPDVTFRRAKAFAAVQGITLRQLITDAVDRQLRKGSIARRSLASAAPQPPWMEGFGGLSDLGDEHRLVLDAIENEFERLSPEDIR